jgi:sugar transferase EpsL
MLESKFIKCLFDLAVSLLILIILFPVLIGIALAVFYSMGLPILYKQQRPGLHGKPFMLYKFRTMRNDRDADGRLLPDEQRLTRFGRFLRSTSLDELPELINVIRGDMSLVGPRPLLMDYLDRYTPKQAQRHLVRPGLTGWAQINGRNEQTWKERLKMDVWYARNWDLLLDLQILVQTVLIVLRREGINAEGYATMPTFFGVTDSSII